MSKPHTAVLQPTLLPLPLVLPVLLFVLLSLVPLDSLSRSREPDLSRNTRKIDFSPFDLELVPSIPRKSMAIVHIKTAQDHVITPRGSGDMISQRSHFFPAALAAVRPARDPRPRVSRAYNTAPEGSGSAQTAPHELPGSDGGGDGDI